MTMTMMMIKTIFFFSFIKRRNRRLNVELEAAIQEAMLELDRMTDREKKIVVGTGRGRSRRLNR